MSTSIDRLHKVVARELHGRGCGRTYARIHELVGSIELGDIKTGVVLISYHNDLYYIMPMLVSVLNERGIDFKVINQNKLRINDITVYFKTPQDSLRGIGDYFEVPMQHND